MICSELGIFLSLIWQHFWLVLHPIKFCFLKISSFIRKNVHLGVNNGSTSCYLYKWHWLCMPAWSIYFDAWLTQRLILWKVAQSRVESELILIWFGHTIKWSIILNINVKPKQSKKYNRIICCIFHCRESESFMLKKKTVCKNPTQSCFFFWCLLICPLQSRRGCWDGIKL